MLKMLHDSDNYTSRLMRTVWSYHQPYQ